MLRRNGRSTFSLREQGSKVLDLGIVPGMTATKSVRIDEVGNVFFCWLEDVNACMHIDSTATSRGQESILC